MNQSIRYLAITAMSSLAFIACGGSDNNNGPSGGALTQPNTAKVLVANLAALNPNQTVSKNQTGTAVVTINGDQIDVVVNATGTDPNIMHMAHIHKGNRCPNTITDDVNRDGVLDVIEGVPSYGPILVAFGTNLSSLAQAQAGGAPMADATGTFNYRGTGSFSALVADLHNRADLPAATGVGKLAPNEDFVPEMGVIVVHGVSQSTVLPATVATVTGLTPQGSVPILCGRLQPQVVPAGASPAPSATPAPAPSATPASSPMPSPGPM